ncbi:MAG: UDP-N-acetylmuramyl-tripeptide synthetase [Peptococcaceae bacterium]|nr:UDP-N-acetylmuramyl-tripeptide synthetase [Peptococcaceae bacterium]
MKLADLIKYTEVLAQGGESKGEITDISYDSREVKPGSLFVAVPGFKVDGHKFIGDALARGASAVIIQDEAYRSDGYPWVLVADTRKAMADLSSALYGFPSRSMNIIGVTGTNGKTTTTNLIRAVLSDAGEKVGLIGTIHNRIGEEIIPVHHTTPEAPDLQKLFREMLNKGVSYVVMEVSSHALDLHRVRGTEYDVAVFTNLTQDHLDFHGSMEKYLEAKGKLFSGLGVKSQKERRKFAIINHDDPQAAFLMEMSRSPVITYGVKTPADVTAEEVKVTAQGVSYFLRYTDQRLPVKLKLTGIFNVYNSLAAIAVGLVEGIPITQIIASLERIPGIPGRFETVDEGQNFTVIVDYSHTPDSLENCLQTAREFAEGRILTVFGCGGDRDRTKRPVMGEVAARLSDLCIVTSDNPRTEDSQAIIDDIVPGILKVVQPGEFLEIPDRREAIYQAIGEARAKDVIVIAGKGHEDYQIIGKEVFPFDDREVAREALRAKGWGAKK